MLIRICTACISACISTVGTHHNPVYHSAAEQIPKKLLSYGDLQRNIHASENGSPISCHWHLIRIEKMEFIFVIFQKPSLGLVFVNMFRSCSMKSLFFFNIIFFRVMFSSWSCIKSFRLYNQVQVQRRPTTFQVQTWEISFGTTYWYNTGVRGCKQSMKIAD